MGGGDLFFFFGECVCLSKRGGWVKCNEGGVFLWGLGEVGSGLNLCEGFIVCVGSCGLEFLFGLWFVNCFCFGWVFFGFWSVYFCLGCVVWGLFGDLVLWVCSG